MPAEPAVKVRAIAADMSKQVPNNSWGPPVVAYVDVAFRCRDCGKEEIWTAEQQKWYYEEAKGSLHARAVRCRDCRKNMNDTKRLQRQQMAKSKGKKVDDSCN
jgi:predicted RNA-binding Zn-ribbon protein involved in translation (DUF1610 family)